MTCGGYPDGVWEQDPRAPWNAPDPWEGHTCGECALCGEVVRGAETEAACFLLAGEMQVEAVDGDGEACEEWRAA